MKKLLLIIFVLIFCQNTVSSQPCLPDGITFSSQNQIDSFQITYPNCTEIEGDVWIEGDDITNLSGLNILTSLAGDLRIFSNPYLTNLTGLDNVTFIGGNLWIVKNVVLTSLIGLENLTYAGGLVIGYMDFLSMGNDSLTSLTGLNNLIFIGGHFQIAQNNSLISLTGLNNLISVEGDLIIGNYYGPDGNFVLTSLSGLDNVTSIGGSLVISHNSALTSLIGLDHIDAASINELHIKDNTSLSTCEVQSVCDYLASPTGTISIFSNATGCNTQVEVEAACEITDIPDINFESEFSINPNPAKDILTISSKNGVTIEQIEIYNQTGHKMFAEEPLNNTIDVTSLPSGLYFIHIQLGDQRATKKIVIIE